MRHTQEAKPVRTERAQMGDKGKTNNIRNANADLIHSRADTSPHYATFSFADSKLGLDTALNNDL